MNTSFVCSDMKKSKKKRESCLSYFLMSSHWILFALRITLEIGVYFSLCNSRLQTYISQSDWNKNAQESFFFFFNVPKIKISEPIVVVDWNRDENNDIIYIYIYLHINTGCTYISVSCPSFEYSLLSPTVHINAYTFIVH